MKPSLTLLYTAPILLLAACATVGNQSPELEVTVEHVSAPQFQMFESKAIVKIRIDNETAEPISLAGGVHHIRINGHRIGKALDNTRTEVPPFSSITRELPLTVSNLGIIRTTRKSFDEKEVAYRLDSRLSIETAKGTRKRSLRREGQVSLDELAPKRPPASDLAPAPIKPTTP